jgi:hypothetical protein
MFGGLHHQWLEYSLTIILVEMVREDTTTLTESDFEQFVIRSVDCDASIWVEQNQALCPHCYKQRRNLLNRFESAVLQREKPIAVNSCISLERTISLNKHSVLWSLIRRLEKTFTQK